MKKRANWRVETRYCPVCGVGFYPNAFNQKYCSDQHKQKSENHRWYLRHQDYMIARIRKYRKKMHAKIKSEKLMEAKRLYLLAPQGISDLELARALGIDRASAYRYRKELKAIKAAEGRYTLEPTSADIQLAEAVIKRAAILDLAVRGSEKSLNALADYIERRGEEDEDEN